MANMNISISGGEAFETYLNTQIKVSERAIPVVKRNGAAMQHSYQEYGTRFMAGTPHIRPAFIFQSKTFINEMEGLVKD